MVNKWNYYYFAEFIKKFRIKRIDHLEIYTLCTTIDCKTTNIQKLAKNNIKSFMECQDYTLLISSK